MSTLEAIRTSATVEEMAEALRAWAVEASEQVGETPLWWVTELQRVVRETRE